MYELTPDSYVEYPRQKFVVLPGDMFLANDPRVEFSLGISPAITIDLNRQIHAFPVRINIADYPRFHNDFKREYPYNDSRLLGALREDCHRRDRGVNLEQ